jgi:plasmid stabilization system protein ParE
MRKPWRLTAAAEQSLLAIARWTVENFGPAQAFLYEQELVEVCQRISNGTAVSQDCRQAIDKNLPKGLRVTRAGEHFVIFLEEPDAIIIIDFIHRRSNTAKKLKVFLSKISK